MKIAKTFRLSSQAVESLRQLVEVTGSNETAIIEISLSHFLQSMLGQKISSVPVPVPDLDPGKPGLVLEKGGRKRHKSKH